MSTMHQEAAFPITLADSKNTRVLLAPRRRRVSSWGRRACRITRDGRKALGARRWGGSLILAMLITHAVSAVRAEEGGLSVLAQPGLAVGDWAERVEPVIPPAARDVKPDLAIVQAHRVVDGEVGSGWRLQTTSVIHRRSSTNRVPTTNSVPSMYLVDGTELVWVTTPGAPHYQPEVYDGSRFDYISSTKTWMRQRDGWTWTYGAVPNSTQLIIADPPFPSCMQVTDCNIEAWYLSSVVDPFGNRIDYMYVAPAMPSSLTGKYPGISKTGERLVDTITYAAGNAKITFDYDARPDLRVDFTGGAPVFETQRLVEIETTAGIGSAPATYSRYRFTHEDQATDRVVGALMDCDGVAAVASATPQQSLLRAIHRVGDTGSPKRMIRCNKYFHGPTTWAAGERVDSVIANPLPGPLDPLTDTWTPMPVDFDGDGRTDLALLALRDGVNAYHKVYIATPNRATAFTSSAGTSEAALIAASWETRLNSKLGSIHFGNKYGHGIADITGDGRPELLYEDGNTTTIETLFAGWNNYINGLDPCDLQFGQIADVDGDHRLDVVVRAHGGSNGCGAEPETRWIKNQGGSPWFELEPRATAARAARAVHQTDGMDDGGRELRGRRRAADRLPPRLDIRRVRGRSGPL